MNKVMLAGRLVADPEPRIIKTGATLCRITVACNDASGRKDEVYFFPCVAWEARAKFILAYFKKGTPVVIDGRLQRRSYVNSDNKTVYNTEVLIDNIKSFGSNNNNYNKNESNESNEFDYDNVIVKEKNNDKKSPIFQGDNHEENTVDSFDLDWLDDIEKK